MTEYIRKPYNILFNRIKGTGEKVTEIMRENLPLIHICAFAKRFHQLPYIRSVKRLCRLPRFDGQKKV